MTLFSRSRNPLFTINFILFWFSVLLYNIGIIVSAGFSGNLLPVIIGIILIISSIIFTIWRVSLPYKQIEMNCLMAAFWCFIFSLWAYSQKHYLENMYEAAINLESAAEIAGIEDFSSLNPERIQQITEFNNYVIFAFIIFGCILVGYFLYKQKKGSRIIT